MRLSLLTRPAMWSFALQRICTWYPLRNLLTSVAAKLRPSKAPALAADNARAVAMSQELERDGVSFLPQFVDKDTVAAIRKHLDGANLRERFAPFRSDFTVDDVPPNVHVAEYATEHILNCPEVVSLANHPMLLAAASRYLGCKPTISNLSIWWSLPADGTAQEAENFHRDVDDWRFVKLFIYLSDVDEESGPHCFIKGSHKSSRFLVIRRVPDAEVTAAFPAQNRLVIHGTTGDAFLEDTFGLHKGQPPTGKRRLLFQVQYSINPIAVYTYRPARVPQVTGPVDAYTNRLYLA